MPRSTFFAIESDGAARRLFEALHGVERERHAKILEAVDPVVAYRARELRARMQ
jgi:hypothetical protein